MSLNMASKSAAVFVLAIVMTGLACFSPQAQEPVPAEGPAATIDTQSDSTSDRAIDRRIEDIFTEIDGLSDVTVSVKAGVVTLRGQVTEKPLAIRAGELAGRVDGVVTVRNEISESVDVSTRLVPVLDRLTNRILQLISYLPLFMVAAFVFLVVSGAGWWIAGRDWPWSRLGPNAFISDLLRQFARLVSIAAGLVLALDILGATALLGTIVGAAGIAGLALGFAVRDTVENYVASIMLSLRQPFRPNDHVLIDDQEGLVISLNSRSTILLSMDGNHIRLPNAMVFKGVIVNYSRNPERRFDFELGVDADSNLDEAIEIGIRTINSLKFVLQRPDPDAWIKNVGDSNVVIWYSGWVDQTKTDFARARSEATRLTKLALENNGFSLPEPIYRLRFDSDVKLRDLPATSDVKRKTQARAEPERAADTAVDTTVTDKVTEERARSEEPDLLNSSAPNELG